jgi:hypothetical protein
MANCCDMKKGDLYFCDSCGLELEVKKPAPASPDQRMPVAFP